MEAMEPPPNAHHAVDDGGEIFVWQVGPDILAQRDSGIFTLPLVRACIEFLEPFLLPGARWRSFVDMEGLTQYTQETREHMTEFALQHLSAFTELHCLLSSKFVALGLSAFRDEVRIPSGLSSVADSGIVIHMYSERASFLHAFADALRTTPE